MSVIITIAVVAMAIILFTGSVWFLFMDEADQPPSPTYPATEPNQDGASDAGQS